MKAGPICSSKRTPVLHTSSHLATMKKIYRLVGNNKSMDRSFSRKPPSRLCIHWLLGPSVLHIIYTAFMVGFWKQPHVDAWWTSFMLRSRVKKVCAPYKTLGLGLLSLFDMPLFKKVALILQLHTFWTLMARSILLQIKHRLHYNDQRALFYLMTTFSNDPLISCSRDRKRSNIALKSIPPLLFFSSFSIVIASFELNNLLYIANNPLNLFLDPPLL